MNQDQFLSLLRTVLKVSGSALAAHGATKAASIVNAEDVIGAVLLIGGALWSHFHHTESPAPTKPTGTVITTLLALVCGGVLLTGCTGVPQTTVRFTIGNTQFKGTFPKQFTATNLVALVNTNGVASFTVGSISAVNDPVVIDKAAAGQVAQINAIGQVVSQLTSAAIQGAAQGLK